jgi:alpha-amylase/alpha-mannosidase (GH57 family)
MILDGERSQPQRFRGHSSAIAQVYNHMILPLASRRDRITQIRWGIADYERRYGARPRACGWLRPRPTRESLTCWPSRASNSPCSRRISASAFARSS